MKKLLSTLLALGTVVAANAALKPGDSLSPYEIKNTATGKQYCQVCQYSGKATKLVAFGNMNDAKFWADLEHLQKLHAKFGQSGLGVFAQVLDSDDSKAIQAKVKKHGIEFPVVVAVDEDWDEAYNVEGVSRTIYFAKKNRIAWSGVGLDEAALAKLTEQVAAESKG